MKHQTVLAALLAIFWLYPAAPADAASCDAIASLALTNAKVTTAVEVAAGAFTPPGAQAGGGPARAFATLPAFCRVAATLTPSSDSDIKIEVWLPVPAGMASSRRWERRLARLDSLSRRWPTRCSEAMPRARPTPVTSAAAPVSARSSGEGHRFRLPL